MNNIRKYAGLLACFSTFGMAQSLQSDLLDCAQINDSLQRLVCYDNLAKKAVLPTQLVAELPIASDTSKAKPLVSAAENFGQENKKSPKDLINQIQGKIVKVTKSAYGKQIVTLDNGQVWRQTDSVRLKLVEGQSVTIKRGALGSFFISKENANKRIRAKRVS